MIPAADFFAGGGGFTHGAERTGRVQVVFAANHWADAIRWHAHNHPGAVHVCQDLQQLDMRILPDLSEGVLLASPACQGHSMNGQPARKGTGGNGHVDAHRLAAKHQADRNTSYAIIAAAEMARPRTIIVENVAHFAGWTLFEPWCDMLERLGYALTHQVLNARDFGTPQDRKRFVLVADQRGPIEIEPIRVGTRDSIADCLDPDDHPDNLWKPLSRATERMAPLIRKAQNEGGARCLWNNVSESRGRPLDDVFPTITTAGVSQLNLIDRDRYRTLNPRELARAMGMHETFALPRNRKLAGKLLGNAIPGDMAEGIVAQVA